MVARLAAKGRPRHPVNHGHLLPSMIRNAEDAKAQRARRGFFIEQQNFSWLYIRSVDSVDSVAISPFRVFPCDSVAIYVVPAEA